MKKLLVRAVIVAVFGAGLTTAVGITTSSTAMACPAHASESAALAASMPQVNFGDRGTNVLALQLALRQKGYPLQGTGNYAHLTLGVVKDFQAGHGIKASGVVGSKTWQALVGTLPASQTGGDGVDPPNFSLQPGERNVEKVDALAGALLRIHPYRDNDASNFERGVYSPELQKMVKDFQRRAGIKSSGIVGPKTFAALYKVSSVTGSWGC